MGKEKVIERIIDILEKENGPLYVKEIAKRTGYSSNTVGKYIEVLEAMGKVVTKRYTVAKQVSLVEEKDQK